MPLSRETLGLVIGTIGVVIFGVTLPMTRIAVGSLDPWFVTSGRATLAGCVALVVLTVTQKKMPRGAEFYTLLVGAAFTIIGFPGFTGFAMRLVPASHGGVVLGILPLAVAMFAAVASGERPSRGFWISALIGAALVVSFSLRDGGGSFGLGDVLLIGSVVSAAAGYTAGMGSCLLGGCYRVAFDDTGGIFDRAFRRIGGSANPLGGFRLSGPYEPIYRFLFLEYRACHGRAGAGEPDAIAPDLRHPWLRGFDQWRERGLADMGLCGGGCRGRFDRAEYAD